MRRCNRASYHHISSVGHDLPRTKRATTKRNVERQKGPTLMTALTVLPASACNLPHQSALVSRLTPLISNMPPPKPHPSSNSRPFRTEPVICLLTVPTQVLTLTFFFSTGQGGRQGNRRLGQGQRARHSLVPLVCLRRGRQARFHCSGVVSQSPLFTISFIPRLVGLETLLRCHGLHRVKTRRFYSLTEHCECRLNLALVPSYPVLISFGPFRGCG